MADPAPLHIRLVRAIDRFTKNRGAVEASGSMVTVGDSIAAVTAADEKPLTRTGFDVDLACEPMALYEVSFRLRTDKAEARDAAVVQFLFENGDPITEEHVSPSASPQIGRYAYLSTDPQTSVGTVCFFAPRDRKRIRLRFRAWSNRHPIFLAQAVFVRRLADWTIAAEPGNTELVRLIETPRPLSVSVPAGARGVLRFDPESSRHAGKVVLHAPCAMVLEGGTLRLTDAPAANSDGLRPFAEASLAVPIDNESRQPVTLALACGDARFADLAASIVYEKRVAPRIAPQLLADSSEIKRGSAVRCLDFRSTATHRIVTQPRKAPLATGIAAIVPDDMLADLKYEPLSVTALQPCADGPVLPEEGAFDFLLVVPDGHRYAAGWKSELLFPGSALKNAIQAARERSLTVVVWFISQPLHWQSFNWLRSQADLVCLSSGDLPGNELTLPTPFQPRLHNPIVHAEDREIVDRQRFGIFLDGWWTSVRDLQAAPEVIALKSRLSIVESAWEYDKLRERDNVQYRWNNLGCIDPVDRAMMARFWDCELVVADPMLAPSTLRKRAMEALAADCRPQAISADVHRQLLDGLFPFRPLAEVLPEPDSVHPHASLLARLRSRIDLHLARRALLEASTYGHALATIREGLRMPVQTGDMPLVTVVLVSKRPSLIESCIDKVLAQTYPRIEFIYVLHGNHADADQVLERVRDAGAVALHFDETFSLAACLNIAVKHAGGDYVAKFDDDDFYGPHYVADLMSYRKMVDFDMIGKPIGFVRDAASDNLYYDPSAVRREWKVADPQQERVLAAGAAVLGKRDVFERVKYPEERRGGADSEFARRCQRAGIEFFSADIFNFVVYRDADPSYHTWRRPDNYASSLVNLSPAFSIADIMI